MFASTTRNSGAEAPATPDLVVGPVGRIPTWFGIGGGAERLAVLRTRAHVVRALELDADLRVLGDGANLLVRDAGVSELVVDFKQGKRSDALSATPIELESADAPLARAWMDVAGGRVLAGAGVDLRLLINETARAGLAGLEVLVGIPATLGGALVMNAGGAFGQIADVVRTVFAVDRRGRSVRLERAQIAFGYRQSGLGGLIVTGAELALTPTDPARVRERLLECNDYKKRTQPLAADSAGCVFKNPVAPRDLSSELGRPSPAGGRVSAGLLLDRAGCKGMSVGGASVSPVHANFVVTTAGASAGDVLAVMEQAAGRVLDRFGVELEREVVVW
ncbi:MAG: FAD-binding protein [Planctomycetota bacterium]|nr:FAD-binding protein [Planctomycetota bacterium]